MVHSSHAETPETAAGPRCLSKAAASARAGTAFGFDDFVLHGSAAVLAMAAVMSQEAFTSGDRRVPLVLSALLLTADFFLRRGIDESPRRHQEAGRDRARHHATGAVLFGLLLRRCRTPVHVAGMREKATDHAFAALGSTSVVDSAGVPKAQTLPVRFTRTATAVQVPPPVPPPRSRSAPVMVVPAMPTRTAVIWPGGTENRHRPTPAGSAVFPKSPVTPVLPYPGRRVRPIHERHFPPMTRGTSLP